MLPPLRRLGALCLLMVFSASIAEGVWASQCLEGAPPGAAVAQAQPGHDTSGPDHGGTCPPSDESERAGTLPCPLAPAGSGCLTISLPGAVVALADCAGRALAARPPAELLPDLPIVSGIERPPRA